MPIDLLYQGTFCWNYFNGICYEKNVSCKGYYFNRYFGTDSGRFLKL